MPGFVLLLVDCTLITDSYLGALISCGFIVDSKGKKFTTRSRQARQGIQKNTARLPSIFLALLAVFARNIFLVLATQGQGEGTDLIIVLFIIACSDSDCAGERLINV
jgi:hypothetical protein